MALSLVAILQLWEIRLQVIFQHAYLLATFLCLSQDLIREHSTSFIDERDQLLFSFTASLVASREH